MFKFTKSKDNKRLVGNFLSLSVLQGTNLVLPLITFPYLVNVLGIEKFGLISFALATVAYFEILTDYGFDLSATRQISIHRADRNKVTAIFSAVLSIKAILSIVSLALLSILVFSFAKFSEFLLVYYFTFGRVVGKSIFPVWFFQGMERMRITTYLNILAKVIFTVAIFIFVKGEEDYLLVPIFNSLGFAAAGVVSLIQIRMTFGIRFEPQSKEELLEHLRDGWHVFLSRIYINLYTTTNTFLLGVLTNNVIVGYYSIADKIIEAVKALFIPANNALYPYMSKLFHESKERFYALVTKVYVAYSAIGLLFLAGALLFGKEIINFVNGSFNDSIYSIYIVLSFKILITPFASFFSMIFINQNRKSEYLKVVKYTLIINVLLVPVFIHFYSGLGMAWASLMVGIFHILLFLVYKIKPVETQLQPH